jgi:hypothetical protein
MSNPTDRERFRSVSAQQPPLRPTERSGNWAARDHPSASAFRTRADKSAIGESIGDVPLAITGPKETPASNQGSGERDPEPLPGRSPVSANLGKDTALEPHDARQAPPPTRSPTFGRHAG